MRKSYQKYWNYPDVVPINEKQRSEVAELKANFVREFEMLTFKEGDKISLDPYRRYIKVGIGDVPAKEGEILFMWGPWEMNHIKNWVRAYLNLMGFKENYHFWARDPVGVIEFIKME